MEQTACFLAARARAGRVVGAGEVAMSGGSSDPSEFGKYLVFAQVGFEMVVPIVLGLWADNYFETRPWCVVAGVVLGLAGGLWHLVYLAKKFDEAERARKRREQE
jgi:hypothetical protein